MPAKKSKTIKVTKKAIRFPKKGTKNVFVTRYIDMKSLEEPKPKKRWKPRANDVFWYIAASGNVLTWCWAPTTGSGGDEFVKFNNCFKTKEEAEAARDKVRELLKSL